MIQVQLNFEAVTPMFLGGADPLADPELRPASFRGVLRFWWRALYGGVAGIDSLDDLRRAEADALLPHRVGERTTWQQDFIKS